MTDLSLLPEALRRLAEEVSLHVAVRLTEWRGGTRVWIPIKPVPAGHELQRRVGREAADWLVAEYGGDWLDVPRAAQWLRAQRNARIRADSEHMSTRELALREGLTERRIWAILAADEPVDNPQQSLL